MSGVTVDIETIMGVVEKVYDKNHELTFSCYGVCWIEDHGGEIKNDFRTRDDLYKWTLAKQIELDEKETAQNKINHNTNAESANVDPMKQKF